MTAGENQEYERLLAWCRKEAASLRNWCAATGVSLEHQFLVWRPVLTKKLKHEFPAFGAHMVEILLASAYDGGIALDMAEVNRLRASHDLPPLSKPPRLTLQCKHQPPMPDEPPPPEAEQWARFNVWLEAKAREAHTNAMVYGSTLEAELLSAMPSLARAIMDNFPGLHLPAALRHLIASVPHMKPERYDTEEVERRRKVFHSLLSVGKEIERRAEAGDEDPPAKA